MSEFTEVKNVHCSKKIYKNTVLEIHNCGHKVQDRHRKRGYIGLILKILRTEKSKKNKK